MLKWLFFPLLCGTSGDDKRKKGEKKGHAISDPACFM